MQIDSVKSHQHIDHTQMYASLGGAGLAIEEE